MTEDDFKDAITAAYAQGALDVHENWQEDRDPDFTEAADDYYASLPQRPAPSLEAVALALLNDGRRFAGLGPYISLEGLEPHQYRDQLRYARAAIAAMSARPDDERAAVVGSDLVRGLNTLHATLARWAEKPAAEQPHWPEGPRPFSTGDLRYMVTTVAQAADRITELEVENAALRHDLERQMAIANEHVNENARLRHHAEAMAKVLDPNNTYGVMLDGRYAVDAYRKEFPDFRKEFFNG